MKNWIKLILVLALWATSPGQAQVGIEDLKAANIPAVRKFLPYQKWNQEYSNYFLRHYRDGDLTLFPSAIVMHYTAGDSFDSVWNTFYNGAVYDDGDAGRIFGHLSSHFIIDRDGTVYYTLPTDRKCRGAYGVNHVALSIEMVGRSEAAILNNPRIMRSMKALVEFLCQEYAIPVERVWGHYEVAAGKKVVPDYLDYGDSRWPDRYPPAAGRTDPGPTVMRLLRKHLKAKGI